MHTLPARVKNLYSGLKMGFSSTISVVLSTLSIVYSYYFVLELSIVLATA